MMATQLPAGRSGRVQHVLEYCTTFIEEKGHGPSMNEIADATSVSKAGVSWAIARLRDSGQLVGGIGDYSTLMLPAKNGSNGAIHTAGAHARELAAADVEEEKDDDQEESDQIKAHLMKKRERLATKSAQLATKIAAIDAVIALL